MKSTSVSAESLSGEIKGNVSASLSGLTVMSLHLSAVKRFSGKEPWISEVFVSISQGKVVQLNVAYARHDLSTICRSQGHFFQAKQLSSFIKHTQPTVNSLWKWNLWCKVWIRERLHWATNPCYLLAFLCCWVSDLYSSCNEAIWIQQPQTGRTYWLNKDNDWPHQVVSVWTAGTS